MHNLFGTDGIRSRVGESPLTDNGLERLSKAIAMWMLNTYGNLPSLLLAHDTRLSASWIKAGIKTNLLRAGILIYDVHVMPTPAVYFLVKRHAAIHAGLIISASHNPYYDNGIKLVDNRRGKLRPEDEHYISQLFFQNPVITTSYDSLGIEQDTVHLAHEYMEHIISLFTPNILHGLTIVLDCAYGAASHIAPAVFTALGAHVIPLHTTPTGININAHCGAVHPQTLQQKVLEHKAHAGFAFDGDADRVIAVNNRGDIKNGDDILAILLQSSHYHMQQTIVGTVMTNYGFEDYVRSTNRTLIRTQVGDKYIAEHLETHNLLLGGEQSGHIIMRDYLSTGDGIFTALRIMETMIHTKNWALESFTKYPQVLISVPVVHKKDLKTPHLAHIIQEYEQQLRAGRLLIRYSGTENVLRVMVEDADLPTAERIGQALSAILQKELS